MKRKLVILCLGAVAVLMVWVLSRPHVLEVERAGFVGFTNGLAGTFAATFISTSNAAVVRASPASFTNAAVFMITNRTRKTMEVFPIAEFRHQHGLRQETPLLLSTTTPTFLLGPGQAAPVVVAVLPHEGRWMVRFSYDEVQAPSWFTDVAKILRLDQEPDGGAIESDWMER